MGIVLDVCHSYLFELMRDTIARFMNQFTRGKIRIFILMGLRNSVR